ncbi:hypothetical protein MPER_05691, partial [Moniliophthora perniciosa FA553]
HYWATQYELLPSSEVLVLRNFGVYVTNNTEVARCDAGLPSADTLYPRHYILATKMITQFGALMIYTPVFVIPGILVASIGKWVGSRYIAAALCTRRECAVGVSIRAYGASDAFERELRRRIDVYTRISRTLYNLGRWMASRVEFLGAVFSSALAAYLVYYNDPGASGVGFSLNMAGD